MRKLVLADSDGELMSIASRIVPNRLQPALRNSKRAIREHWSESRLGVARTARQWALRDYDMPAPQIVKWSVLSRYGSTSETWIETGTYLGDTTAYLARKASYVYSIEPMPELARAATRRFRNNSKITIIEGTSENQLVPLLQGIRDSVSFWFDGHYSKGNTFQGPSDTPIRAELAAIEPHLARWNSVTVFVDDVRCFEPTNSNFSDYPTRGWLVTWAERNSLNWLVEHDIFVAHKP